MDQTNQLELIKYQLNTRAPILQNPSIFQTHLINIIITINYPFRISCLFNICYLELISNENYKYFLNSVSHKSVFVKSMLAVEFVLIPTFVRGTKTVGRLIVTLLSSLVSEPTYLQTRRFHHVKIHTIPSIRVS